MDRRYAKGSHRHNGGPPVGGGSLKKRKGKGKHAKRATPKPIEVRLGMATQSMLVDLLKQIVEARGGESPDIGAAAAAEAAETPMLAASKSSTPRVKFSSGQPVDVTIGATRRRGRITHAHKDGTYTVTYSDPTRPQNEQPREKRVDPKRIFSVTQDSSSSSSSSSLDSDDDDDDGGDGGYPAESGIVTDNFEPDVKQQLKNLRLLDQLEAADRRWTKTVDAEEAAAAAIASNTTSTSTDFTKDTKARKPKIRLNVGLPKGPQKLLMLDRKVGTKGLLDQAKGKLKTKKLKYATVAKTGEIVSTLEDISDDELLFVWTTEPAKPNTKSNATVDARPKTDKDSALADVGSKVTVKASAGNAGSELFASVLAPRADHTGPAALASVRAKMTEGKVVEPLSINKEIEEKLQTQQRYLDTTSDEEPTAMRKIRESLPAYGHKDIVVSTIAENRVSLIAGSTGCGKTTQIPQFLLEDAIRSGSGQSCNIICTQPRRISAIGVAERVAAERQEQIGKTIGYKIRLESRSSKATKLMFVTTGVLLRRLQRDPTLENVSHVIIDEIHERGVLVDFLLIILRNILQVNSKIRIILMSATMDATSISDYFGGCPTITIPGFTYPVEIHYLEQAVTVTKYDPRRSGGQQPRKTPGGHAGSSINENKKNDAVTDWSKYPTRTKQIVEQIDASNSSDHMEYGLIEALLVHLFTSTTNEDGAVLIFLPGIENINKLQDRIKRNSSLRRAHVIALHSSLPSHTQRAVFNPPPIGKRKVVLSTNIAETSITINDVTVVIDAGRVKEMRYDASRRMGILEQTWISQASATQRSGRAGRVKAGTCYRLYSREMHERFKMNTTPEIKRVPIEELILQIKIMELGSPIGFLKLALTPPEIKSIEDALQNLLDLGALSAADENYEDIELTPLGFHLALLPIDPRLGKMLIYASIFQCVDPILTIAASMSLKTPFQAPLDQQKAADAAKRRFDNEAMSDHLAISNAFNKWLELPNEQKWEFCRKNFLSSITLQQILGLREQLKRHLRGAGFLSGANSSNLNCHNTHLLRCILTAGLYPNVVRLLSKGKDNPGDLVTLTEEVCFHPSSLNFKLSTRRDRWAVYLEKVKTSRTFIRDSTIVTPFAILLFGGTPRVDHNKSIINVDRWIEFRTSPAVGVLFRLIREELDSILLKRILSSDSVDSETTKLVAGLANLLQNTERL